MGLYTALLAGVVGLILLALIYLVIRWIILRRVVREAKCPQCGGTQFQRVHRTPTERFFGWKSGARRYKCASADCNWSGLRSYHHHGHGQRASK